MKNLELVKLLLESSMVDEGRDGLGGPRYCVDEKILIRNTLEHCLNIIKQEESAYNLLIKEFCI